ncbi:MAG: hypothetical protein ABIR32_07425, partial [Ilumatobacteraceae bacterium]
MSSVLFVADDTIDTELSGWLARVLGDARTVYIITPVLGTRIERATDSDEPAVRSGKRLELVLAAFEAADIEATGEVITDPPFEAVKRMLLDHTYDRIVLGVRADTHWKEADLADRIRAV